MQGNNFKSWDKLSKNSKKDFSVWCSFWAYRKRTGSFKNDPFSLQNPFCRPWRCFIKRTSQMTKLDSLMNEILLELNDCQCHQCGQRFLIELWQSRDRRYCNFLPQPWCGLLSHTAFLAPVLQPAHSFFTWDKWGRNIFRVPGQRPYGKISIAKKQLALKFLTCPGYKSEKRTQ